MIMSKKNKFFADDGWAFWVDGDDTSTIYLNNWLNPKGISYMDVAIHIRGIKETKSLNMYFPFAIDKSEFEDVSLSFENEYLSVVPYITFFNVGICIISMFSLNFCVWFMC